jgi:acyl-CoA hydrolase
MEKPNPLKPRNPSESCVETTHMVLPQDTNVHGTAFGGIIMQWMDIAASIAAGRHCQSPVVTVSVDDLVFAKPIRMGDVVIIKACVNHTGHTSMEVGVKVESEQPQTRQLSLCLTGYFTFVAVDNHGKPVPVPRILPTTPLEQARFQRAEERREQRLKRRSQSH